MTAAAAAMSESPTARNAMLASAEAAEGGFGDIDTDAYRYLSRLAQVGVFGIDIGGTSGKIAFLAGDPQAEMEVTRKVLWGATGARQEELQLVCHELGGTLHFLKWATHRTEPFCQHVRKVQMGSPPPTPRSTNTGIVVRATGGGAFKFEDTFRLLFGLTYRKLGEFDALAVGFRHLIRHHPDSVYAIDCATGKEVNPTLQGDVFPATVCNIGSGVSVLKLEVDGSCRRLGGTSIGGSTFLGLCKLACGVESFEDALRLAQEGDSNAVDITVSDIYGERAEDVLGLPGSVAACSFGRLVGLADPTSASPADIASSILSMVTQAIEQISLGLSKASGCKALFFTGGFLRGNMISQQRLAEYCALQGERALFLRHAEYAGALGCLCTTVEEMKRRREQDCCD